MIGLRPLSEDMHKQKETRAVFEFNFRDLRSSVVFLTAVDDWKFELIWCLRLPKGMYPITFKVEKNTFEMNTFLGDDIEFVVEALGLTKEGRRVFPFRTIFEYMNQAVPSTFQGCRRPTAQESLQAKGVTDPERRTRCIGIKLLPKGHRMSEGHFDKTVAAYDECFAVRLRAEGITTVWVTPEDPRQGLELHQLHLNYRERRFIEG